jgi:hypothetical protein
MNWTTIKGSFIADSNYKYIVLGNFFDDAHTDTIYTPIGQLTYFFIDDVCVSTDSAYTYNYTYVGIENIAENKSVTCFPNPFHGNLNFQTPSNEQTELYLYDMLSRLILHQTFISSMTINAEKLAEGIYIYELRNKSGVIKNGKVVKE